MSQDLHLIDIVGYDFYLKALALTLAAMPIVFYSQLVYIAGLFLGYKLLRKIWEKYLTSSVGVNGRGVFITGCDTGLGFAFATCLDEIGFTVFAGCLDDKSTGARKLRQECSKRLHVIQIDITRDAAVRNAFTYVKNNLPRNGLWGVVNNAGMNMFGPVEVTPVSLFEKGSSVNLYGAIRVTKEFLPLIRKTKGRIVNITSVHARFYHPSIVNYEVSKTALEQVSDSLRMEMKKFGVRVSAIEPSMFGLATSCLSEAVMKRAREEAESMWNSLRPEVQKYYQKERLTPFSNVPKVGEFNSRLNDLKPVSESVIHALCSEYPHERYLVAGKGFRRHLDEYAILARVRSILPTWTVDSLTNILLFKR